MLTKPQERRNLKTKKFELYFECQLNIQTAKETVGW